MVTSTKMKRKVLSQGIKRNESDQNKILGSVPQFCNTRQPLTMYLISYSHENEQIKASNFDYIEIGTGSVASKYVKNFYHRQANKQTNFN